MSCISQCLHIRRHVACFHSGKVMLSYKLWINNVLRQCSPLVSFVHASPQAWHCQNNNCSCNSRHLMSCYSSRIIDYHKLILSFAFSPLCTTMCETQSVTVTNWLHALLYISMMGLGLDKVHLATAPNSQVSKNPGVLFCGIRTLGLHILNC